MPLLFNMLSRLVIAFLPRSKRLLIFWLQSPSAGILEPQKIKSSAGSKPHLELASTCVVSVCINSLRSLVFLLYFLGNVSDVVK